MNDKTNVAKRSGASFTNQKQNVVAGAIAVAALGAAALGAWIFLASPPEAPMATAGTESQERRVLYWTDPMVPGFQSEKPGKSPFMDMELVPVYADDAGTTTVSVRPEIVQSLGVRTHTVTRGSQPRRIAR